MKTDIIETHLRKLLEIDRQLIQLPIPEDDESWINNRNGVAFDLVRYCLRLRDARHGLHQAANILMHSIPHNSGRTYDALDALRVQIGGEHKSPAND